MTEITLDRLSTVDLERLQFVEARDTEGNLKLVWDSRRLFDFLSRFHPGTLAAVATVPVQSLDPEHLAPLYAKLAALDTLGERRLVH